MNKLIKINEKTIREIIAKFYDIRTDDVCLYCEYKLILQNEDKVWKNFIYGIVEKQED